MLRSVVFTSTAACLVLTGCLRWQSWMRTRRRETQYLAVALVAFGIALLLHVPTVVTALDRHVWHLSDGAILASHLLGLLTAWGGIELCAEVTGRGSRGRVGRLAALLSMAAALALVFVIAEPLAETPLLFERYARAAQLRAYWVILVGAIIAATAYLAYVALRHTHHDDRWLRRGLGLIGVGSAMICLFAVSRLLAIWADLPGWVEPSAIGALSIGASILAAGASLPYLTVAVRHHVARRSLYPIWRDVTARYPHVRAGTHPQSLYRLIIEIQDALAEARSHNELETPLMQALDHLPAHLSDDVEGAVEDLLGVAISARRVE